MRQKLIQKIQKQTSSKVISYITGGRQPFATQIDDNVVPVLAKHLENISNQKKISLFLYTHGGSMVTPIRIVKLIRSFTDNLEILVPYKAHSAGTLLCLGANDIVMGRLAELSPVDPTTVHPYNPENPQNKSQKMGISVEDLNSYFLLAKEKANVPDEDMVEIFKELSEKIHPLAVGNIYRAARMAKQIAEKLLKIHTQTSLSKEKRAKIVTTLTSDICIHGYPITRDEAQDIGLNIKFAEGDLEKNMWNLYEDYAREMKLNEPFNPIAELGADDMKKIDYSGAFLESEDISHEFKFKINIKKDYLQNKMRAQLQVEPQGWVEG